MLLEKSTHRVAKWIGSAAGFGVAIVSILIWFGIGTFFNFSTSWENAISIYIGIITFLMIFVMQRAQIKELAAVHVKLNELIASTQSADNTLINAEELTEQEISEVQKSHREIAHTQK